MNIRDKFALILLLILIGGAGLILSDWLKNVFSDRQTPAPVDSSLTAEYPTSPPDDGPAAPSNSYAAPSNSYAVPGDSYAAAGLNSAEQYIYGVLRERFTQVANGELVDTVFEVDVTGLGLTRVNEQIQGVNIDAVLLALQIDCPYEEYWYRGVMHYLTNYYVDTGAVKSITFQCEVYPEYALGVPGENRYYLYVLDPDKMLAAAQAVQNARAVVSRYSGLSDYDKLTAYRDYICDQVEYDHYAAEHESEGKRVSWEFIYVFDNDPGTNVVCEGYTKAFKYLCDLSDFSHNIDCCLVYGDNDGSHAWNLVRVDGQSYLVDVTNSDSEWGRFGDLFLAGADGATGDGFTIPCPQHDRPDGSYYEALRLTYTYSDEIKRLYSSDVLTLAPTHLDPAALS